MQIVPEGTRPLSEAQSTIKHKTAAATSNEHFIAGESTIERLELEFFMALDALTNVQNEAKQNASHFDAGQQSGGGTGKVEELQTRYELARQRYKAELWHRDFEPVLQEIREATDASDSATVNIELEATDSVRRLVAYKRVVQKEKNVLDGLLGEMMRIQNTLGDIGLLLGTSGAKERWGFRSDNLSGNGERTVSTATARKQENGEKDLAAQSQGITPGSITISDAVGKGRIDIQKHIDRIFASLQNLPVKPNGDDPTMDQADNYYPAPNSSTPLMATQLYAAMTESIIAARLRTENAALRTAMDEERKQLDAMITEVQFRNEEDLSLAATQLIEAVKVQAQTEQVRAVTRADLAVSVRLREEAARRRSAVGCHNGHMEELISG